MNRTTRTALVAAALIAAVAFAAPGATALEADDGEGGKYCERVGGINVCVAVAQGDCLLWFSAGMGGCFAVPDAAS